MSRVAQHEIAADDDLRLVPLPQCDADEYIRLYMANLPSLTVGGVAPLGVTRDEIQEDLGWKKSEHGRPYYQGYGIHQGDRLVGEVGMSRRTEAVLQCWVDGTERRRGVATRAVTALVQHIFATTLDSSLRMDIGHHNGPSQHVARKLGAVLEQESSHLDGTDVWRIYRDGR